MCVCMCVCACLCACAHVFQLNRELFWFTHSDSLAPLGNSLLPFQLLSFYFMSFFSSCAVSGLATIQRVFQSRSQQQRGNQQWKTPKKQPLVLAITVWRKNETKSPSESQLSSWERVCVRLPLAMPLVDDVSLGNVVAKEGWVYLLTRGQISNNLKRCFM